MESYKERIQKIVKDEQEKIKAEKEKEDAEIKAQIEEETKKEKERNEKFFKYIMDTIENKRKDGNIVISIEFNQLYDYSGGLEAALNENICLIKKARRKEDGIEVSIYCKKSINSMKGSTQYIRVRDEEAIDLFDTVKVKEIVSAIPMYPFPSASKNMLDGFLEMHCTEFSDGENILSVRPNYYIKIV